MSRDFVERLPWRLQHGLRLLRGSGASQSRREITAPCARNPGTPRLVGPWARSPPALPLPARRPPCFSSSSPGASQPRAFVQLSLRRKRSSRASVWPTPWPLRGSQRPSSVFRGLSSLCRTASAPTALFLHPALVSRHSRHLLTDPRLAVFVVCCLSPPTRMSTLPGQRVGTGLFGGTTTPQAPRAKSALRAEGAKASRHAASEPGVGACTLPAAVAGASLVGPCEQPGGQWAPLGGRSRVRNGPAQSCAPGQQEGVREGVTGLEVAVRDTGWGMPGPLAVLRGSALGGGSRQ